ncbi:xanthine dehydrogenase [Pusillimonas sp. T2]|uniref:xanthine dehydrogenase family protein molybdopterin-binding subunit n=1 Tax=Pusillimonas sp. T2 TaxID=1548123 RepID=UPI000B9C8C7C|nr:xanthine dehydrogenase family protein molybdopterin-binding subunit [Pusillimonas sp. T2]OXR50216.1 xanthine dehydrogenase [Pusillimonas sp. T2]
MNKLHEFTNGLVGTSQKRSKANLLVAGRGTYLDDLRLGQHYHIAFYRSPFARARFALGDNSHVEALPGVYKVISGRDLLSVCGAWVTSLALLPQHVSAPQHPLAIDEVFWQGEPVVAIVADTRAQAEDALDAIDIDWEELDPVVDAELALMPSAPLAHPAIESNLALERTVSNGDVDGVFENAPFVVSHQFSFGRQTGVPLESRGVVAQFDARNNSLVVYQSHQSPFQMQEIYSRQLGVPLSSVRVICPDVGGAFGIKLHAYPDEMAAVAIAKLLGITVKYQADRLESFVSDAHARDAKATASLAVDEEGTILGLRFDVLFTFGAVSLYPRSSVGEALQVLEMCGSAYRIPARQGRVRGAFVNKVPTGAYRAVGQPLAAAIIEQLLDNAAAAAGIDRLQIRRKNYVSASDFEAVPNEQLSNLSLQQCLDTLAQDTGFQSYIQRQKAADNDTAYVGVGLCTFIEQTGVGAGLYGRNGVRVAGKESVRLQLQADGSFYCATSASENGQGAHTGLAQIIADTMGCALSEVVVCSGDTQNDPLGGGTWASRGIALGGEAALRASQTLKANLLAIAAAWKGFDPKHLQLQGSAVIDASGEVVCTLAELAYTAHYDSTQVPLRDLPPLAVERSFAPSDKPYFLANGIQAAAVKVDIETGEVKVLDFWVVEDCGRVINPMLVDEQVRGGVVQGIGAALYENCTYSETGQMTNASLADYLVPMASEMPDIKVLHVSTPERETLLGAKGVGEAGTVGAIGAIWSGVNDALRPVGVAVEKQPFTPEHILSSVLRARHQ